MKAAVRN